MYVFTRAIACAVAFGLASTAWATPDCWEFEEVNVPSEDGSDEVGTSWWGLNNRGVFVGNYCIDADCWVVGAAVYDSKAGTIETYSYEDWDWTEFMEVNDHNQIAGGAYTWIDGVGWESIVFVFDSDGEITALSNPDLGYAGGDYFGGHLNNRGDVVGTFWDSDAGRLQDGRASYGTGFNFIFLGGLQFNWMWAKRLGYQQYNPVTGEFFKQSGGDTRSEFYIVYDW